MEITTVTQNTAHDDPIVNRIVDGKLVPCRWSELTEDERRVAYANLFVY